MKLITFFKLVNNLNKDTSNDINNFFYEAIKCFEQIEFNPELREIT
jgi:hypothetical protein